MRFRRRGSAGRRSFRGRRARRGRRGSGRSRSLTRGIRVGYRM